MVSIGFNFYHSLNDPKYKNHPQIQNGTPKYRKYLWLNYSKFLARHLQKQDTISDIFYFSAYAQFRSQRSIRTHQLLVSAWESTGITAVMGNFKQKHRFCINCSSYYLAHEEKETDVNIAIYLINEAYKDTYQKANSLIQLYYLPDTNFLNHLHGNKAAVVFYCTNSSYFRENKL